jgi:putative ABC transport system permease protein
MSWTGLFHRRQRMVEALDQDIRDFIDRETQDNIERGLPPEEARYAALRKFGNATRVREETREVWSFVWLEQIWQDVRFGLRTLSKSRGFTAVAIITLGLGIGANTAIFSLANAAFFRGFPFPHADRLAFLWQDNTRTGETEGAVAYPNYADWRAQSRTFEDMAFITFGKEILTGSGVMAIITGPNGPEQVAGALVSTNFFSVLGVNPLLGRGFVPEDALMGHTGVAVISYGFGQERFGGGLSCSGKAHKIRGRRKGHRWGHAERVYISRQYPNLGTNILGRPKPPKGLVDIP